MSYRRGTSLRQSFSQILWRISSSTIRPRRLKGNYLFRSIVRRILDYIEWLTEEPIVDEISDDVVVNIRMAQQKKVEKKGLTREDRSMLLTSPGSRTSVERTYIYELFKKFHAFRKYPEHLKRSVAGVCVYQYLKPGRVIVRQGHQAENLYFILNGEVTLSRVVTDRWTDESKEVDTGTLTAGDMFGEIALLHTIPRNATVVTKTIVDLLLIPREYFDKILRRHLSKEWDVLQDALVHFNYFRTWDKVTVRECCILSRMKDFRPGEILLGDGKGMVNYVHFLLEGECRLIEHMIVREQCMPDGRVHYELYDPTSTEETYTPPTANITDEMRRQMEENHIVESDEDQEATAAMELLRLSARSKLLAEKMDLDRSSIITTTLVDVVNEWHKVTDVAEMLMREPSSISQQCYPKDVRTIFMQICTFQRGACFGLGSCMLNRRIVATSNVRCFLIPRYFLHEHNRANIWEHVKLFMNSKYPTREELFKKFVRNRRWRKYKKNLVDAIRKEGRQIRSNVTIHDVPYSIRINDDVGV
ncbi:PREDICTED: uncharacterized protein LOC107189133 [Dufourea novaeangliae]|uniref:uncharacterized protein LOC107189133 n=1 Tax=Dufourea novaeangliae TaxID=178035 RepID=UPI000767C846|nr:PREDICTED: uncharacterized protein LOC107189133 [Dufourea novaeangliae]